MSGPNSDDEMTDDSQSPMALVAKPIPEVTGSNSGSRNKRKNFCPRNISARSDSVSSEDEVNKF